MNTLTAQPPVKSRPQALPQNSRGSGAPSGKGSHLAGGSESSIRRHLSSLLWLAPVLLTAGAVQIVNIAGTPRRIDDEGTYVAQAWAITNLGELTHYTYWYDHPPLGWIQIAIYAQLTDAFDRWDTTVLAGREAMVVALLVSAILLWALCRRMGFARVTAAAATLIFSVSPLAVQFHRYVYLDNIAVPWLLAAFLLAMSPKRQLGRVC
ncbi:4-amino-4-deoxy-L-arabinose transferase-like glycosyltransferase [Arthrobacter sp. CAN_A214]|uniref:ArnT family glycosyltransferase n=1 Tax=Arthrobacter sp. CAN_A214 TaxID=2787720 RepID=UPI0018C9CBA5